MGGNSKAPRATGPQNDSGMTTPQPNAMDIPCPSSRHPKMLGIRGGHERLERIAVCEERTRSGKGWRLSGIRLTLDTSGGPGPTVSLYIPLAAARELYRYLGKRKGVAVNSSAPGGNEGDR